MADDLGTRSKTCHYRDGGLHGDKRSLPPAQAAIGGNPSTIYAR